MARFLIFETIRATIGIIVISSFARVKVIQPSSRTDFVRNMWRGTATILVMVSVTRSVIVLYLLIRKLLVGRSIVLDDPLLQFGWVIIGIAVLLMSILVIIVTIFYPETLLLSHSQIVQTSKIYEIIERYKTQEIDIPTFDFLTTYLLEIAESLPKEDSQDPV
ncbi:MAG: hypothetical protein ACXAC2_04320 [Candidatus Kariarchaeaceae archaeon]